MFFLHQLVARLSWSSPSWTPVFEADDTSADDYSESWTFDRADRTLSQVDAGGATITFEYDIDPDATSAVEAGRLWRRSDGASYTATDSYSAGRLSQRVYAKPSASSETVTYSYDGAGRLVSMGDATGTTDWGYDTLGNVVLVEGPLFPGSGGVASEWDRSSNRRLLTYTDGAVRRFDHDQAGRVVEIALAGTGGTWWPDATMSYDAVGRLLEENVLSGGEVARRSATYNTAGKMTTYTQCWDIVADACDDETNPATAAVYDAAIGWRHDGRVGSVCVDADDEDACSGGNDYIYDVAGQLRGSGPGCELVSGVPDGDCVETWSYDGQGHRVDHDPDTATGSDTVAYSYDDSGRLTTAVVGGSATTSYSYDAAGRRTGVDRPGTSSDETFGYNPMGRLDQWTRNSTAIATLHTDGQGTLSAITQGTLTFPLIWDTTGVVPGLVQVASIRATWADHAISSDNGQWYGYDWLDNTNQTATSNTNPGVTLAYDPYGGIDNPQSTYLTFGFGMRASLTIGGYVHLHNRTYDPETGTFFTPDPLDGITATPTVGNAYHYTDNDPLNKTDPTGLRAEDSSGGLNPNGSSESAMRNWPEPNCIWDVFPWCPGYDGISVAEGAYLLLRAINEGQGRILAELNVSFNGSPSPVADAFGVLKETASRLAGGQFIGDCRRSNRGRSVGCVVDDTVFTNRTTQPGYSIGHSIFCANSLGVCESDGTIDHELVHVNQYDTYGDHLMVLLTAEQSRHGYWCSKYEMEAFGEVGQEQCDASR